MANLSAGILNRDFVIYSDEKTAGTSGGDFDSGDWRVRTLNTTKYSRQTGTTWASLAANLITLKSGSYLVEASAPGYDVGRHVIQFFNDTDATTAIFGTAEFDNIADQTQTRSFLRGVVTINAEKDFELQHQCSNTKAGNGFGADSTITTNTYAMIKITKLT